MIVNQLPANGAMVSIDRPELDDLTKGLKVLSFEQTSVPLLGSDDDAVRVELHRSLKSDCYGLLVIEICQDYDLVEVSDYGGFARFLRELMPEYRQIGATVRKSLEF